jgi:type II secretory pathway pseudopilin PulG
MKKSPVTDQSKAFTLIEVLAAMTVLILLMMALVRIFTEASAASQKANVTVSRNAAARATLEMIRNDLEGAVVDRNLALYKEANTLENNFDRLCFITSRHRVGSWEAHTNDYAYVQVQYFVTDVVVTNSAVVHTSWVLKRAERSVETARSLTPPEDPFTAVGKRWWRTSQSLTFDYVEVIDNVIRFDVWVCNQAGVNAQSGGGTWFGGWSPFDSSLGSAGVIAADQPPAFIEVYLQVTSDDAMRRGALAKAANQMDAAYATFYRESDVLVTRITSLVAAAERVHPLSY